MSNIKYFSAWLKGTEDEVVERINKRLEPMTNLEMETAEELQIANYGIGGKVSFPLISQFEDD